MPGKGDSDEGEQDTAQDLEPEEDREPEPEEDREPEPEQEKGADLVVEAAAEQGQGYGLA